MTTLDSNQFFLFLQGAHIDRYWEMVKSTFQEVLDRNDFEPVDNLRRELRQCTEEEQILFYHAEPLDVAADLVGISPDQLEGWQLDAYAKLLNRKAWGIATSSPLP